MKSPQELAAAKLGKAVHPAALDRLFELAPEAQVRVQHEAIPEPQFNFLIVAGRGTPWTVPHRTVTTVAIQTDLGLAVDQAVCLPTDQWDRRKGIKMAFDRALDGVRELTNNLSVVG